MGICLKGSIAKLIGRELTWLDEPCRASRNKPTRQGDMMDLYRMLETQDPSLPRFLSELSEFEYAKLSSQGDCTLSAKGLEKNNQVIENCSTCEHWEKIKMGSEWQIFGECALGETNTLSHPNITFEDFHCSKQNYKRRIL